MIWVLYALLWYNLSGREYYADHKTLNGSIVLLGPLIALFETLIKRLPKEETQGMYRQKLYIDTYEKLQFQEKEQQTGYSGASLSY